LVACCRLQQGTGVWVQPHEEGFEFGLVHTC
jgi:hypothetical protein